MRNKLFNIAIIGLLIFFILSCFDLKIFNYYKSIIWAITSITILALGIYLSLKLNFLQLNIYQIFKVLFTKNISKKTLVLSLSSRIGVGSLSGIALAIYLGGIGTIFWMWIFSFIMAINTYLESFYGVLFSKDKIKGPSSYIKNGLNNKFLSVIYAILIIITYVFSFTSIQTNTIIKSLNNTFNFNKTIIISFLVIITIIIIFQSTKKLLNHLVKITYLMISLYLLLGLIIIIINYNLIVPIIIQIIHEGLNFHSGIISMIIIGLQRAVFATESGVGTSSIISASTSNKPHEEGKIQIIGIYFTTLVICTLTAIIIISSNSYQLSYDNLNGIEILLESFNYHFGILGKNFLAIIVCLFAYSTIISSYYYGEVNLSFLVGSRNINLIFKVIFIIIIILSYFIKNIILWNIADILLAILSLINLSSITKLYLNDIYYNDD